MEEIFVEEIFVEEIFVEEIFANKGSENCEFRGRNFREFHLKGIFPGNFHGINFGEWGNGFISQEKFSQIDEFL